MKWLEYIQQVAGACIVFFFVSAVPVGLGLWLFPLSPEQQRMTAPFVLLCSVTACAVGVWVGRLKV